MEFNKETLEDCFSWKDKYNHEVVGVNNADLAKWVMKTVPIRCVVETKEVLTYFNGKYIPNGQELIHRVLVNALEGYVRPGGATVYNEHLFKEVMHILTGLTYTHANEFDENLNEINLRNGILNWRTMEFRSHDPERDLCRIQLPVDYDQYAICPSIEKIFRTVLHPEDYLKGLEFIAYCLYREYPIQKVFIMIGPGKTGKSRFLDIITSFLGHHNCASVSMHDLERDRFATSDLYGALFNGFGDMEQTNLPNVNILKMLTSNKDRVRAQKKGRQAFEFVNFAKFMFGTNKLAKVLDDTTGFYRRVELLPFDHVFTRDEYDPELLARTETEEEKSGLLNLVLPYLAPLLERGEFTNSYDTETAANRYKVGSDPIGTFIETFVEECPDAVTPKDDIYNAYCKFCEENAVKHQCRIWFGRDFAKVMPWKTQSKRNIDGKTLGVWLDLKLRKPNVPENPFPN